MRKKHAFVLLLLTTAVVSAYLLWPSDTARIKRLLREGARAVESEDIDGIMAKVSFNYHDEYGLTYLYLRETLKRQFENLSDIKVEYGNVSVYIEKQTGIAEMDISVLATVAETTGFILGGPDQPVHIRFTLEKERATWLVVKAEGLRL